MLPILGAEEYFKRLMELERPGSKDILACYEHRLGVVHREPRLMLMPMDDHMAHRGDGIFDNLKYLGGRIYQLNEHLARMENGCAALSITPPCSWADLRGLLLDMAAAGGEPDGLLRVLIGRGPGGFGVDPAECPTASLYIVAYRFRPKPESWFAEGLSAFKTGIPAKKGFFAHLKSTNYLSSVLMTQEARTLGFDVPISYTEDGFLAESAVANICLVDEHGVLVAPEFDNILPGTTILRAFELARGKITTAIRQVRESEVKSARELLMLGTSPDCAPITSYDGAPIHGGKPGPVAKMLRELIQSDIRENGVPVPGLLAATSPDLGRPDSDRPGCGRLGSDPAGS